MAMQMNKALVLLLSACLIFNVSAQNKDGNDEPSVIIYKIKSGDTINQFALKYLQQPVDITAIQAANPQLDIDRLKIGTEVNIPRRLVKYTPAKATIMGLSCGTAIRIGEATKPLTIGSVLHEGAVIEVPAECHVSLLLEDSSVIRLPSSAALKITILRKNVLEPTPEVRLDLARGRVELDVFKGRTKTTPFEIRTPLSIMGVRGTEFRVGYSPEDGAGQVEVLGGIVQTRGTADTQGNAITKGLGVPIDASGKALAIENLLDAPTFLNATRTPDAKPSYAVKLAAVPKAYYYTANIANTANLAGNRVSQHLLAPELFISSLTSQASFYQLNSVSRSGLVGTERIYGFCTPATTETHRCSAIFDAALANTSPIAFSLSRTTDGKNEEVVNTQGLQARNGRFAIRGLPSGQYSWTLSYMLTQSGSTTPLRQSGTFELIVLPQTAP
jgi:hypothetical protein